MTAQPANSSAESQQIAVTDERPWPGLASFLEQDAPYFKGRDDDIRNLYSQVNRERLTVFFGVSGLGKSSLLQAGLFPQLRQDNYFPVLIRLDFSPDSVNLNEQVFTAIVRQAQDNAIEAPQRQSDETLWEYFHRDGMEFWNARNRIVIPILCFDQFEEIFTLGRENPERIVELNRLIQELADLIEGRCPENIRTRLEANPDEAKNFNFTRHPYKLIFSLREDYLADLEGLRAKLPSVIHNRFRLLPMNGEQAMAVVDQTRGRLMSSCVAENIVRLVGVKQTEAQLELSAIRIEPALLSLFCHELNEQRIAAAARQIDAESASSNREQILQNFYERSLDGHVPELRRFIEDKLVTVSGFRNSEAYDNALSIPGVTVEALNQLVQNRLLRLEERDGHKRIELIHDVLTGVVRNSREQRALLEKQQQAEQERLAALQREQQARIALQSSRRRVLVFALLTVACLVTAIWSVKSEREAKEANRKAQEEGTRAQQANRKVQHALAVADFREAQRLIENYDPARTLAHLAQAVRLDPSWLSSRTLLINLLQQTKWHLPELILKHGDGVTFAAFSADGTRVVTASSDKTARVWDAHSGQALGEAMRHVDGVRSAAFSADGTRVVTASSDNTARVWDAHSGKALGEPMWHERTVNSAAFSVDGTRVVTASSDNTARVWDAQSGKALGEPMRHEDTVKSAAFSADGTRVVTTSWGNTARVWDARSGKALGEAMRHENSVLSAAFSVDGMRVVTASSDKTARVWDALNGKALSEPMWHKGEVTSATFSVDGTRVVTASRDNTARVWDAHSGKALGEAMQHQNIVTSAAFSADGTRVVTASVDNTARVWDAKSGQALTVAMRHEGTIYSAAFSTDGTHVVTASNDKTARVWDAQISQALGEAMRHESAVWSAAFSTDGTRVVTASRDNTARMWDARSGKALGEAMWHEDSVSSAAFNADGTHVVTASRDNTARVWDTHSGKALGEPMQHEGPVISAAFSVDGTRVVTASRDNTARVWDAQSGKALTEAMRHENSVLSAAFSVDGTHVVTASSDKTARVWDAHSGQALGEAMRHADDVISAAFSADGTRIVTASLDNTARVWDAQSGKALTEAMRHEDAVISSEFSADGAHVVTASKDKAARVWDAHSGKALGESMWHKGPVTSAAFSADGTRVVTASWDKTARLWDAHSGKPLGEPMRHENNVSSAAFSVDGTRVVTSSLDSTARIWDVLPVLSDPDNLLAELAEAVAGLRLGEYGAMETLDDQIERLNQLHQRTANAPLSEPTAESFVRWFLSDPWTRTISPLSGTTVPEYIQQEIAAGRREQVARELPGHPLLRPSADLN